jgi:hypothetical protein
MKLTSVIAGMAASSLSLLRPWYARAATSPGLISGHHSVKQQREQQHRPAIPDGLQAHSMANTLLTREVGRIRTISIMAEPGS